MKAPTGKKKVYRRMIVGGGAGRGGGAGGGEGNLVERCMGGLFSRVPPPFVSPSVPSGSTSLSKILTLGGARTSSPPPSIARLVSRRPPLELAFAIAASRARRSIPVAVRLCLSCLSCRSAKSEFATVFSNWFLCKLISKTHSEILKTLHRHWRQAVASLAR